MAEVKAMITKAESIVKESGFNADKYIVSESVNEKKIQVELGKLVNKWDKLSKLGIDMSGIYKYFYILIHAKYKNYDYKAAKNDLLDEPFIKVLN